MKVTLINYVPTLNTEDFLYSRELQSYCYIDENGIEIDSGKVFGADDPNCKRLKIFRFISSEFNPLETDFTIIGLEKSEPEYIDGRKSKTLYKCKEFNDVVVSKTFSDILENGKLCINVTFDFYTEDNQVGLTKTEIVKRYSTFDSLRVIRERQERSSFNS